MQSARYSRPIPMKLEFSRRIEEYSNIKFHKNPCSKTEVFHLDRRADGQTDMTTVIVAFLNFGNAPITSTFCLQSSLICFAHISEQRANFKFIQH